MEAYTGSNRVSASNDGSEVPSVFSRHTQVFVQTDLGKPHCIPILLLRVIEEAVTSERPIEPDTPPEEFIQRALAEHSSKRLSMQNL